MILIFGGTTEGRKAMAVADEAGKPFWYSTRGSGQAVECVNGTVLHGAMETDDIRDFCCKNGVRLIVDAAHPFATRIHRNVIDATRTLGIAAVRYERTYAPHSGEGMVWCSDYDDAIRKLRCHGITRLLALTGVQTIGRLAGFWRDADCWFRILRRDDSLRMARKEGFPEGRLVYYGEGEVTTEQLIADIRPQAIITKESGESGGFGDKAEAARKAGIPLFVVERPPLPAGFHVVNGPHGLRRAVEKLLPEFFELHTGLTTGTCATAAAMAAIPLLTSPKGRNRFATDANQTGGYEGNEARTMWDEARTMGDGVRTMGDGVSEVACRDVPSGENGRKVMVRIPDGEDISVDVKDIYIIGGTATATVIKDAGDDPDITNGFEIKATVRLVGCDGNCQPDERITILGGEGVGTVTLPGLGLPIGGPAINAVPQKMIRDNIMPLLEGTPFGAEVTISVPQGREAALRTFNPRLGVVGGISIIGTSGIVRPFSLEAWMSSVRKYLQVAVATGAPRIVINSGARSERFLREHYPELPQQAFVHYGNFIGETIRMAADLGIRRLTLGVMIGKAVKLAEGNLDTHSRKVVMNKPFLVQMAREAGCGDSATACIEGMSMARELWTLLPATDMRRLAAVIIARCHEHCAPLLPCGELEVLLVSESGEVLSGLT